MKAVLSAKALRPEIVAEVERRSGQNVRECYQCGKCSAGCPIFADLDGSDMDLSPNKVMRLLQLGMGKAVLRSRTIWLCAGCATCTTRCPREVDLASIMEALRIMALEEGIKPDAGLGGISLFDNLFMKNVRFFGRLFEMDLVGRFNMLTFNPFKDILKAPGMFFRGKLGLIPSFKGKKTATLAFEDARQAKRSEASGDAVAVRPEIKIKRKRKPKQLAVISECCTGCSCSPVCQDLCPVADCMVLVRDERDAPVFWRMTIDHLRCIGCKRCTTRGPDGICLEGCPQNAISMVDTKEFEAANGELPW